MRMWYELDRKEFLQYMSSENHAAPFKKYRFSEGRGKGTEAVEVHTGTGLSYTVLPDRCCDIAEMIYKGVPLSWISNAGVAAPAYCNSADMHWRDTFTGGLLTTCGLHTAGPPSCDEGIEYGLHGSIGHTPGEEICTWGEWKEDTYYMHIRGKIRYAFPLAGHILLERHIWSIFGKNEIHIEDRITNLGADPSPLMLIYHMNFGYPLVGADARFCADAQSVEGTSPLAKETIEQAYVFDMPEAGYKERAYTHCMNNRNGETRATLYNLKLGLGITLQFSAASLPRLSLWKHLCSGNYLAALEPMNCPPIGREKNRKQGTLPVLKAGESCNYSVTVTVHEGEEEICEAIRFYEGEIA